MEHASDVISVVDEDGRHIAVSASVERMFGFRPDELIGKTPVEVGIIDPEEYGARLDRAASAGEFDDIDAELASLPVIRHKDGHRLWVESAATRVGDKIVVITREVTARAEMARMWRALMANSNDVIVVAERESGRYISVSDGFQQMFGFSREDVLGRTSVELGMVGPDVAAASRARRSPGAPDYVDELVVRRKDGSVVIVEVAVSIIGDYVVAVMRDVTERRQLELEKDAFIAYASHELRTPAAIVLGAAETLADRGPPPPAPTPPPIARRHPERGLEPDEPGRHARGAPGPSQQVDVVRPRRLDDVEPPPSLPHDLVHRGARPAVQRIPAQCHPIPVPHRGDRVR